MTSLQIKRDKKESVIFRGDDNSYYEVIGKTITDITDQVTYDIPNGWLWCRISSVFSLVSGRDLKPAEYNDNEIGIPYITGASNFCEGKVAVSRWTQNPQVISINGDLLLTCKGTVGELAINELDKAHIARQVMAIRVISSFDNSFLALCIQSYVNVLRTKAKGLIPGISREDILNLLIPIPPINEQKRIADKVSQLFSLLDFIVENVN